MNASELLESVREDNETALSRLGSSKSLYAATGGEMETDSVLRAAADAEYAASRTFEQWADSEPNEDAAALFGDLAAEETDHYETVAAELDDDDPRDADADAGAGADADASTGADADASIDSDATDEPSAMQSILREFDTTVERTAGLLGRLLATEKSKEQLTGFFVGQADPGTAQLFRDLGDNLDDQRDRTLDLLDDLCNSDDDWTTAKAAADAAIQAAYDEYTEQLEALGVNPKPVC